MTKPTTLRVRVAPERLVVYPQGTIANGRANVRMTVADGEHEVPNDRFVRARLAAGDLVAVTADKPVTAKKER